MWCRTILTAIAISYVICMLLWSGLQKEELDASTLEKLSRYNVNIEDLNNEQRRQECLLNHLTTEAQREALRTSASKDRIENDVTVEIYPKIEMLLAANFEDKAVVQFNSNDTTGNFKELRVNAAKLPDLGNVTAGEANKAIIKIEYNIQNQPDVESVMNFWTKLTHRTTTVATLPTTLVAPLTKTVHSKTYKVKNGLETAQAETQNDGYVHSREMEYISRILTEYLASQTVPTTTESISTNTAFANYVPTKYWELSNKAAVDEEPKVDEKNNQTNKMNATQDNSQAIYNSMIDEDRRKPFKETFDTQLMKIIQETPSSQTLLAEPKVRESKPVERTNAKGFLNRLLRMKSDLFNNGFAIPETESETKATNKSNKQQDKINSYKLFNLFKNIKDANKNNSHNFTINGDQSINASIKAETMTNKPEPEVRPTDVKKSEVHENTNLKHRGSRFQAMLPSIKYSKQNKNSESVNRQVIGTPTEFNKPEQHENDEVEVLGAKKGIVSQQPAAIQKFDKNQLFKMKKDIFNTDSKKLNAKQFKKSPMFQTLKIINDSERIKAIQEIVYQPTQTKDVGSLNMSDLQAIPASIITEIAEQVKRIVLKDLGKNVTTTTVKTTSSTSNITTSEPPPTTLQNKITQSNHVMQKLMEIFKELNTMKDTAKLISQMPQNSSTVNYGTKILSQSPKQPQTPASFNPYLMQNPSNFKPKQATFYASMVPAPSSGVYSQNKLPQYLPPLNAQPTKDYHFGAITIQTNSDEIAPLPIQISKPTKLMNQHIVLTTKRTVDKMKEDYTMKREQESMRHIEDQFRIPNEDRNHRQKVEVESDLPKSVRFAEKHEVRDRYSYRGGYREKPLYHEYHEKVHNIEHPVRSRFPELHYPGRLAHLEHSGRPRDLSTSEDSSPSRGYSRPGYNKQESHKSGIRHHPGSYSHSAHDRQPQYEATKFHEKLERIENWPRSTWKDFHSPSDSSNDEISARQQMPLVKMKKRTRYDDTHFTNFLKSQQKVTDMLEKILANNLKNSDPHSVDTP